MGKGQTILTSGGLVVRERRRKYTVDERHFLYLNVAYRPFGLFFFIYTHAGWLLLAESQMTRRLLGAMVRRIAAVALPVG